MADIVNDALPQILVGIQKGIAELRGEVAELRESVERRLDRLEAVSRKQRRDSAGMLVLMRATAGDFEERVSDVEQRILAMEAGAS